MSALTASRNTPERAGDVINLPVAASTKLFVGALVALNSSGYAVPASDTAGLKVQGRCEGTPPPGITGQDVDNSSGSNGDLTVDVKRGVYKFNNGASGEALAAGDVGKTCYVVDDNTVGKVGGTNKIKAGRFLGLDTDGGAWVDTRAATIATGAAQTQDDLIDNSGGAASTTLAAITAGSTYAQADLVAIKNAVATFAAELAKVKTDIAAIK